MKRLEIEIVNIVSLNTQLRDESYCSPKPYARHCVRIF